MGVKPSKVSTKTKVEKKPVEKKGGFFAKKTPATKKASGTKTPAANSSKKTVSKKISNKNAVTPVAKASKPSFFDSLFKKSPPKKKLSTASDAKKLAPKKLGKLSPVSAARPKPVAKKSTTTKPTKPVAKKTGAKIKRSPVIKPKDPVQIKYTK